MCQLGEKGRMPLILPPGRMSGRLSTTSNHNLKPNKPMNTEEIVNGNKLILEFMGYKYSDLVTFNHPMPEYDSSWEHLMPVVEKIGEYHYPDFYGRAGKPDELDEWYDTAYLRTFGMRSSEGKYMVRFNASTLIMADTLIEATWLAVIDFITWYNQNKK
jgi:hypothetical protein